MQKTISAISAANAADAVHDKLRHATFAYLTEEAARRVARKEFAFGEIIIIHSPIDQNPSSDKGRLDYWIDEPSIVRSWEKVLYSGLGKDA